MALTTEQTRNESQIWWTSRLLEAASRNPSLAGRDLAMEIIARGPEPEPEERFNPTGDIRAALRERIGSPTIPQVFVGGNHIGGATETFDAFNNGTLQALMKVHAIHYDDSKRFDAHSFLPKWLQPR